MKGYFTKLADRATPARAPVIARASAAGAADPFENIAPVNPREANRGNQYRSTDGGDAEMGSLPSEPKGDRLRPLIETQRREARHSRDGDPLPRAAADEAGPSADASPVRGQERLEPTLTRHRADSTEREQTNMSLPAPAPPPQHSAAESTSAAPAKSQAADDSTAAEEDLKALAREQVQLLRKADAFMGHLLERRQVAAPAEESGSHHPEDSSMPPQREGRGATAELAPRHDSAARIPTADDERPSLVIGQLTVEVASPTPAPAAQPRVVVVREGRGQRGGPPLLSGRRIGLGQF